MVNYRYLGYGITDNNGQCKLDHDAQGNPITHSYTGTGAGELDIIASLDDNTHISERSIQSEIYEVLDCKFFDDMHTGTASGYWWIWGSYPATISRADGGNDYTKVTTTGSDGYYCFNFSSFNPSKIEFDLYRTGGTTSNIIFQLRNSNMGVVCQYSIGSFNNLSLEEWYTFVFDLEARTITCKTTGQTLSAFSNTGETQFILQVNSSSEERIKNFKVY